MEGLLPDDTHLLGVMKALATVKIDTTASATTALASAGITKSTAATAITSSDSSNSIVNMNVMSHTTDSGGGGSGGGGSGGGLDKNKGSDKDKDSFVVEFLEIQPTEELSLRTSRAGDHSYTYTHTHTHTCTHIPLCHPPIYNRLPTCPLTYSPTNLPTHYKLLTNLPIYPRVTTMTTMMTMMMTTVMTMMTMTMTMMS